MQAPSFQRTFSPSVPTVAVVNSNKEELAALGDLLLKGGYFPILFDNPADALEQIQWVPPDLVIIENFMSQLTAVQFVKSLKGSLSKPPPCVVLADVSSEALIVMLFEAGVRDYIRKPIVPGELRAKLKRVLGNIHRLSSKHAEIPVRLGNYRIIKEIGRGGMGVVYKAQSETTGGFFALKTIWQQGRDSVALQRFRREARILRELDHRNLVKIHETGQSNKTHYYVMDWVEGVTLGEYSWKNGGQSSTATARVLYELASALCYLHKNKILHRDIKPANVMLDNDGRVLLIDFGLAKCFHDCRLTGRSHLMGTPHFMAPEIIQGLTPDSRSDLFSLGILALEVLLGESLIETDNPYTAMQALVSGRFTKAHEIQKIDKNLAVLIDRLVEIDPKNRYQSACELIPDLRTLIDEPTPTAGSLNKSLERQRLDVSEYPHFRHKFLFG